MDKLNKELKKKLTEQHPSTEQLHSSSSSSSSSGATTPSRPRSRSATHNPNGGGSIGHSAGGAVRPQPAPIPFPIARLGSSSSSPADSPSTSTVSSSPSTSTVTSNTSGSVIGRSRATSVDSPMTQQQLHQQHPQQTAQRSSLEQRVPHLLQPNRPVPPPRTSPAPSPVPSPSPSPRGTPAVATAAAASPPTALPLTGRPRSPTPPTGTPRRTVLLRQIEEVLIDLNANFNKASNLVSQNKDLIAAKGNAESLKVLFSQLISGGSTYSLSSSGSSTTDPYWLDKVPQIIKVQTHWRRILAQRKFIALVNQNPVISKRIYRRKVVKEILTTEKSYLDGLRTLVNDYQNPLQKEVQSGRFTSVSDLDLATIFSNVSAILQCNEALYKDLLEATSKSNASIGAVFKKMAPYFRMYSQYVTSRDAAQTTLAKCKQDEAFHQFFEQKQNSESQLWSLLITPVQRIPRYVLLLSELLKRTVDNETEKAKLKEAVELMRDVAEKINETKRVTDSLQKLVEIQQSVSSAYNFVEAHRIFIREGFLSYQIEDDQPTETYAYLLSDVCLLTMTGFVKSILTSITKKCIVLPLVDATVSQGSAPNTIVLMWEKANYMSIKLISKEVNSVWLPDITKCINALKSYSNPTTIEYLKPIAHYGILCRKTNMRWKKSVAMIRGGGLFLLRSAERRFEIQKQFKLSKIKVKELENNRIDLVDIESGSSTILQAENAEDLKIWVSKLGSLCSSVSSTSLSLSSSTAGGPSSGTGLNLLYFSGPSPRQQSS